MKLNDTQVRHAKAREKQYKLTDGRGLFLLVKKNGTKAWHFDYRYQGLRKTISFGVYPDVSLALARKLHQEARTSLAEGLDPARVRADGKEAAATARTFESIAREWHRRKHEQSCVRSHSDRTLGRLENHVFPRLGGSRIDAISAPEILRVVRPIEARGHIDTAHRVLNICSQVFRYAIATGRADRDPTRDLLGALPATKAVHRASLTHPKEIGALLRAIDDYSGATVVRVALQVLSQVFVRPGELRLAEWSEFDLEAGEWRIPAARMKMRQAHIVPLANQTVALLESLPVKGELVFPSPRGPGRPLSNNTLNAALRSLGYSSDQMTAHGFRSMASTLLNEMGRWHWDAIERQLAHAPRNNVRAAYNHADYLTERRRMMQAWADYLERLKAGSPVVPLRVVQ
ncbi:MAG: integrase arm-type DNA-binding domain-containing protein [Myxococcota bacterium]